MDPAHLLQRRTNSDGDTSLKSVEVTMKIKGDEGTGAAAACKSLGSPLIVASRSVYLVRCGALRPQHMGDIESCVANQRKQELFLNGYIQNINSDR